MITNVRFRLARKSDASWMAGLSRDYIEHGLSWRYGRAQILRAIADREFNAVVAGDGTHRLGFGIMEYGQEAAHLVLLGVLPKHRNQGLGRALVTWLEKPATVAGLLRVRVEVRADNPAGIAFYERLGYRECTRMRGYYDGRVDALRFDRPLCTPVE